MALASLSAIIPQPVRRGLRRRFEFMADPRHHPGLALMQLPLVGDLVAALAPARRPPVLIAALPRSGSSWVGRIVGASEDALYLREPVTQSYLKRLGHRGTPFFEWDMGVDARAYDRFISLAFNAIPRFGPTMVPLPGQWALGKRAARRAVIKEVNPLILDRLWQRFKPKIVLLVRHPAPVALSFHTLGWTSDQFCTRFGRTTLIMHGPPPEERERMSYWEQSGAFQAMVQNVVASALTGVDYLTARFEDVCRDPLSEFQRIFDYCGLSLSDELHGEIERSSFVREAYAPGRYDTARDSAGMANRWRQEMKAEEIEQVRRGYLACRPLFYDKDDDW